MPEPAKNSSKYDLFLNWSILLPFGLYFCHSLIYRSWLIDDAGISIAYARNFVHGYGMVSQVGAGWVEGFSNPLWTIIIAPFFLRDPQSPIIIIKIISLVFMFIFFLTVKKITLAIFSDIHWAQLVTVSILSLIAVNSSIVIWTASGLENPLYALLAGIYCLSMTRYFVLDRTYSKKNILSAGLSAAGLALTRPDGILFIFCFPITIAIRILAEVKNWKRHSKVLIVFLITSLFPFFLYIIFRIAYFRDIFPNTYYAKGNIDFITNQNVLSVLKIYHFKTLGLLHSLFHGGSKIGFIVLLFCTICSLSLRKRSILVPIFILFACSWIIYCLLPMDWMGEYRFATLFFIFFFTWMIAAIALFFANKSNWSNRSSMLIFVFVFIILFSQSARTSIPRSFKFVERLPASFLTKAKNYGCAFNEYADFLEIKNSSLLCPDMGGALYYSKHMIFDMGGLCDRTIAKLINFPNIPNKKLLRDYVFDNLHPTFIHTHDFWSVIYEFHLDPRFRADYVPIREFPSIWAEKIGKFGFFSGDYVRKDAIKNISLLGRLKKYVEKVYQDLYPADMNKVIPFPRRMR